MDISHIDIKKFKVMPPTGTLFEPPWYVAKEGLCPLCGNKLRITRDEKKYICTGAKHGKAFVISSKKVLV